MDMVGHCIPFQNFYALISTQFLKHIATALSHSTVKSFLAVFGDKDNMILAFPFHMSHTLPILHSVLLSRCLFEGLPQEDAFILYRRNGKAFSSLTAKGRGLR
jgi:hypothetical protein